MKKYLLYSMLGVVSLFSAACHEDFNADVAAPQQWEQEDVITLPGFSAKGAIALNLAEATDSVSLFVPSIDVSQLPEGAYVDKYRIQLTADIDNATATMIEASNEGKVLTASLQDIIVNDFGKRPVERTYDAIVYADVMLGSQASLIKAETEVTVIPQAPFISTGYYLIGDICGWNPEEMPAFNHSGKDVYEDPEFSIMFSTNKPDSYWKIIPQSNLDEGNAWIEGPKGVLGVAVDGDPSLEGKLVAIEGVKAGKIENQGLYKMTINMMDYTYKIVEVAPEYYLVGALQGWNNQASGMTCMLYPQDIMNQSYTTQWNDAANLKIWMGPDFGNWDKAMGTATDGDSSVSGNLDGNGAIACPEPGAFYTFAVDFSKNAYTWTKLENQTPKEYTTIGLIGDFNSWGGDAVMTQVTPHNWYLKELTVDNAGGIKFRADSDWKDNWGGKIDLNVKNSGILEYNSGDNIQIAAGTYNVFFNDITLEFVFKKL